jgi:hypothetical protein
MRRRKQKRKPPVLAEGQPAATLYPLSKLEAVVAPKPKGEWEKGYVNYLLRGAVRTYGSQNNGH